MVEQDYGRFVVRPGVAHDHAEVFYASSLNAVSTEIERWMAERPNFEICELIMLQTRDGERLHRVTVGVVYREHGGTR